MAQHAAPTILLIDDDETIRDVLGIILRRQGYRVLEAARGADALALAAAGDETVDLVISDVVMPGMSGPRTVECLQGVWPELKVVYISGYDARELQRRGVPSGSMFLQKPVTSQPLLRCLALMLGDPPVALPPMP